MSEKAKELLLRLKKEKKVAKQMEIVDELKNYNQLEMVNHVLLVHLQRKDHDSLRLEILSAINPRFEEVIQPFAQILNDKLEPLPVKEKAIQLLGETRNKKAMNILLKAFKKTKDSTIKDNIISALTFFHDKSVIKLLIKALRNEALQMHVLIGLARNEHVIFTSKELIIAILSIESSGRFETIHYEKIIELLLTKFEFDNVSNLQSAIKANKLSKQIEKFQKELKEIEATLLKVS